MICRACSPDLEGRRPDSCEFCHGVGTIYSRFELADHGNAAVFYDLYGQKWCIRRDEHAPDWPIMYTLERRT